MLQPTLPAILLGILALACLAIIVIGLRAVLRSTSKPLAQQNKILTRTTVAFILWVCVIAALSISGVLSQFQSFPPRPMLIVFIPIGIAVVLLFTKGFTNVLRATPAHWLVLFQSFRIVVELLLWQAYEHQLIPVQMTFEGRNFDMAAGVLALAAGWVMWWQPQWAWPVGLLFNLIGLALLINIMVVAVLSLPTPMRYFTAGIDSANVTTFPFIYLPATLVVLAFAFHLFSLRQLALQKKERPVSVSAANSTVAV